MYRSSSFILLALFASSAFGSVIMPRLVPDLEGRVVGGEDTTIEEFPHQVSVRILGGHSCGGSIINSRTVLTAAHCIYTFLGPSSYTIQYGVTNVGGTTNVINVERIVRHPGYNSATIDNDVALLFLSSDITFGPNARPIEMATSSPDAGTPAIVSGWGTLEENGATPTILQQAGVFIVSNEKCRQQYEGVNYISNVMLCAAVDNGGKDACQGDSGGPLIANGKLVGIVSWGVGCARPDYSGVYSNVANLLEWIESNMN
ncbi:trypsin beta [Stomoxys calcitrans]|uniref:Peptidase S1 domain-containing protein n=1 Tax=Stomoxys calcitrans TaxID=35570 RepID=A0A1I8Q0B3_STOCA|nr:trypsin beta [Stomoxys calcitrans]